jgi:hypothetical protein
MHKVRIKRLMENTEIRLPLPVLLFAILLTLLLIGWMIEPASLTLPVYALISTSLIILWGKTLLWGIFTIKPKPLLGLVSMIGLTLVLLAYLFGSVYLFRTEWFPQKVVYDFISNLSVTERLVDPALLKVESWDIQGEERQVLFVHPSSSGTTSLVYPTRIEPNTTFRSYLAMAPEAWFQAGDGVVFSLFVEDESGMHLLSSRYVDAKHHQQDRDWLPFNVDLSPYNGKLVRLILTINSGPAGDSRYDWAGWGEPRLERPWWP